MKKIRIVFVHHRLVCGGAENALFDLIGLMDKEKFDITVFAQRNDGVWDEKFRNAGIPVIYDYSCRRPTLNPIVKAGNISKKLRTAKAYQNHGQGLLDVCLPEGTDIVVSYNVWENEEMVFAKGAKTVKYIHGDPGTNPDYRKEAVEHRELLSRFDRIVCVSQAAWNSFREISGLREGVEQYYNPLNSENVRRLAQENVELPEDVPLICAVGRLSKEKAFERLIIIHKRLLDQGIRHKLVIVGDGTDREYLERLLRALDIGDSVILAGYQSNPYPYMKRSRFLVNSSYTEGLPVIAMEALSLGVPVVAPIPSVGEAFGGETCGIITENDNASLEAGIRKMLTDEAFYRQTKISAEKRSTFFDGKRMVQELEQMFQSLVQE
ncbi:MAG: glycosyltransferase [Oscillospiraceae bacterium]|nr:glycosyltransferase [Oscillospiraceae bacterium]